jgi:hypothetical protein
MARFEFETGPHGQDVDREDGGMALILNVDPAGDTPQTMFVRVQGYSSDHTAGMNLLIGRRVRVTVETVDGDG